MQSFDENGVPTIRRSIPMVLFGWALLVNLFYLFPRMLAQYASWVYYGVDESGADVGPQWRQMSVVIGGLWFTQYIVVAVTAYAFFNRRRAARRLVPAMLIASMAISVLDAAWCISLAAGDQGFIATTILSTAAPALFTVAWTMYFLLSKRFRETMVYPLEAQPLV
ncbi:MAG TPA: DUF2569 family protein [Lacipirellula sp.]